LSIQNIGRNKWRVVVKTDEILPSGYHRYIDKVFNGSKAEAQTYERKLEAQYAPYNLSIKSDISVGEYLYDIWLPSLVVQASTIRRYADGVKLLESIHKIPLDKLNVYSIENAIHALPEGHPRHHAKKVLSVALNAAVRWGTIQFNPLSKAEILYGEGEKQKYTTYSTSELLNVLDAFKGCPSEAVVLVIAGCGLSREEALALNWSDLDLSGDVGIININKAWIRDNKELRIKNPKNPHRVRTAYLQGIILDRLKELSQDKEGALWPGKVHAHTRPDVATHLFEHHITKCNLRYIPLNHLRHTYATLALAAGVDVALVSKNLGHARISTTVDYYIIPLEDERKAAAAVYAAAIEEHNTPTPKNLPKTRAEMGNNGQYFGIVADSRMLPVCVF